MVAFRVSGMEVKELRLQTLSRLFEEAARLGEKVKEMRTKSSDFDVATQDLRLLQKENCCCL